MKKAGIQKISLEKLTITRLNSSFMKKIDGGSSVLTSDYYEQNGVVYDYCYIED